MEISFHVINFRLDFFSRMQILLYFAWICFGDGEILITLHGIFFRVATYAMFISSIMIAGKNRFFAKLLNIY